MDSKNLAYLSKQRNLFLLFYIVCDQFFYCTYEHKFNEYFWTKYAICME